MRLRRLALAVLAIGLVSSSVALPVRAAITEISFVGWGSPEERVIIQEALADFERQRPDIHVRYTQIPGVGNDYLNKVRLMAIAGMAPDVFYVPDGAFAEFANRRLLLNLDPMIAKSKVIKTSEIWPSSLDRYRWNGYRAQTGNLYCLPKDIGPKALFYNKDVLRARGVPFPDPKVPMTWDEALAVWRKLTFKGGGLQHYGLSGFPYEDAVMSNGGRIVSEDKYSWVMTSPEAIAAVQWCADLGLSHRVAPDGSKTAAGSGSSRPDQLFEAQIAAMHIDGRWLVPRFRKMPFDWDVAPIPVPRKGMKSVTWSGSVGFGIQAKTRHPDAAFQLIEYLAGPKGQTLLTRTGLQVPNQQWLARTDVYMQKGQKPSHPEVFLASALDSRPGPWTDTPNTFWHDVYWNYVGKIWRGERKAKDLLPEIAPVINQTLRENNPEPHR